jgi:hypothetical protein
MIRLGLACFSLVLTAAVLWPQNLEPRNFTLPEIFDTRPIPLTFACTSKMNTSR